MWAPLVCNFPQRLTIIFLDCVTKVDLVTFSAANLVLLNRRMTVFRLIFKLILKLKRMIHKTKFSAKISDFLS